MSGGPPFWQRCLDAFREELTPQQFNTWIRPLALENATGGYRLLAHNRFVLQWVKERFLTRITELATEAHGHPVAITLAVADGQVDNACTDGPAAPLDTSTDAGTACGAAVHHRESSRTAAAA